MKNFRFLFFFAILFLFFVLTLISIFYLVLSINGFNFNGFKSTNSTDGSNYEFLVKDVDGYISVFENNKAKPVITLNRPSVFLPEYDRKMLVSGIGVYEIEDLKKLVEDYVD